MSKIEEMGYNAEKYFLLDTKEEPTLENFVVKNDMDHSTEELKDAMKGIARGSMDVPLRMVLHGKFACSSESDDAVERKSDWDSVAYSYEGEMTKSSPDEYGFNCAWLFANGYCLEVCEISVEDKECDEIDDDCSFIFFKIMKVEREEGEEEADDEPAAKQQKK